LFEFLQDLRPRRFPGNRLNAPFRDFSRALLQLDGPRSGDFIGWLFQTGKDFLDESRAIGAIQA
jgi:hypothetical protein